MKRMPVSLVRGLSSASLAKLEEPVVVFRHATPIAVLLPYAEYKRLEAATRADLSAEREPRVVSGR